MIGLNLHIYIDRTSFMGRMVLRFFPKRFCCVSSTLLPRNTRRTIRQTFAGRRGAGWRV